MLGRAIRRLVTSHWPKLVFAQAKVIINYYVTFLACYVEKSLRPKVKEATHLIRLLQAGSKVPIFTTPFFLVMNVA